MDNLFYWFQDISTIGAFASILSLIPLAYKTVKDIINSSPNKVIREFFYVFKDPKNYFLLGIIIICSALSFFTLENNYQLGYLMLVIISAFSLLLISIFIRQSKPLIRQRLLHKIKAAIKKHNNVCSAIKFDVDLIIPINEYSYAVGDKVIKLSKDTLAKYEKELNSNKKEVISIKIEASDEFIWILPNMGVNEAAKYAERIRQEVEQSLDIIPFYQEAKHHVIADINDSDFLPDGQENIGTISAGVAAYTQGAELLLSNISTAVKHAKKKLRNKIVIFPKKIYQ